MFQSKLLIEVGSLDSFLNSDRLSANRPIRMISLFECSLYSLRMDYNKTIAAYGNLYMQSDCYRWAKSSFTSFLRNPMIFYILSVACLNGNK